MPVYALDTLRQGLRLPAPWVLLGLGVLAGFCGLGLAVLALGEWDSQAPALIVSTAQLFGALAVLWVLARLIDEDEHSPLAQAADCTRPGRAGRLLGRWLGVWLLGLAVATAVALVLQMIAGQWLSPLRLHTANILLTGLVAAWGVLLATTVRGPGTVLGGLLLWALGHLPWGAPGLLEGHVGAAVGGLLPGPRLPATVDAWLAPTGAAIGAVVLVALALGGRARFRP